MITVENVGLCLIIASALSGIGLVFNRIYLKKGLGSKFLRNSIVLFLCPMIVGLTLLDKLPPSVIAVVIGTIIGYAFAKKENK